MLFHRCKTVITEENKQAQREIKQDLKVCYPEWALRQGKQQGDQRLERERAERGDTITKGERKYAVIPYYMGLSKRLMRVYKSQ